MLRFPITLVYMVGSRLLAHHKESIDIEQKDILARNYAILKGVTFTSVIYGTLEVLMLLFVFPGVTLKLSAVLMIVFLSIVSMCLKLRITSLRLALVEREEFTKTMLLMLLADLVNVVSLLVFMAIVVLHQTF